MSIFQTGNIIITGARYLYQIEEAYHFLNRVIQTHNKEVLRIPTTESTKAGIKTVRKKKQTIVQT